MPPLLSCLFYHPPHGHISNGGWQLGKGSGSVFQRASPLSAVSCSYFVELSHRSHSVCASSEENMIGIDFVIFISIGWELPMTSSPAPPTLHNKDTFPRQFNKSTPFFCQIKSHQIMQILYMEGVCELWWLLLSISVIVLV